MIVSIMIISISENGLNINFLLANKHYRVEDNGFNIARACNSSFFSLRDETPLPIKS